MLAGKNNIPDVVATMKKIKQFKIKGEKVKCLEVCYDLKKKLLQFTIKITFIKNITKG